MATPHPSAAAPDTLITLKITINNDVAKRLKVQLRDLSQQHLFAKLRQVLDIKPVQQMVVERYSDSAGGYITLAAANPQVFKTLIRAAKAKLKLRLKLTVTPLPQELPQALPQELPKEKVIIERPNPNPAPKAKESSKNSSRESTAMDQRSVGAGIFQWREARASQQTLVNDEAPVPRPFTTPQKAFFDRLAAPSEVPKPELTFRTRTSAVTAQSSAWSVYCNECDKAMINSHYHCSICDGGDYDLCEECVASGSMCADGHWLIKRSIQDGKVVNSTTERIQPRKAQPAAPLVKLEPEVEAPKEMPGAFTDESKSLSEEPRVATRTCNNCVIVLAEREFVTCLVCADFDLCIKCHTADNHGHHPAHGFQPATVETVLPLAAQTKLAPGRNVRHNAICDGCDEKIFGVRHKCMNCPDWDYCSECVKKARTTHPRHRFAALFEPIPDQHEFSVTHTGIHCDGPLCKGHSKQYIQGVRYKCTICHDTDFCASCEALPSNPHNRTHPLIKLKTSVRNVAISTESEDVRGNVRIMGDRSAQPAAQNTVVTEAAPVQSLPPANAATLVQTVAEIKPTEVESAPSTVKAVENMVNRFVQKATPAPASPAANLGAVFVTDSVPDGRAFEPEARFTQIWTMKNTGPDAWPSGCSVRFVGGDNMLNVENRHPASVTDIANASESNIVGRDVAVGELVAFKVTLKAPRREGRSISYWRLKSADGTPFGHRLWCDIEVKKAEPETAASLTAAELAASQRQALPMQKAFLPARWSMAPYPEVPARPDVLQPMWGCRTTDPHFGTAYDGRDFAGPSMQPTLPLHPLASMRPNLADQPPAYDAFTMAGRFKSMRENEKRRREQQKQHRDQAIAQMTAPHRVREYKNQDRDQAIAQMTAQREALRAQMTAQREALRVGESKNQDALDKLREQVGALLKADTAAAAALTKSNGEGKFDKIVEEITKATKAAEESAPAPSEPVIKPEGSQMVFPKLDKESPESSAYESFTSHSDKGKAAYVENEQGEVEQSAAAPSVSSPLVHDEDEFESVDDELEVLSAIVDSDDEDGFVTDEEYDILDASDSETIA